MTNMIIPILPRKPMPIKYPSTEPLNISFTNKYASNYNMKILNCNNLILDVNGLKLSFADIYQDIILANAGSAAPNSPPPLTVNVFIPSIPVYPPNPPYHLIVYCS